MTLSAILHEGTEVRGKMNFGTEEDSFLSIIQEFLQQKETPEECLQVLLGELKVKRYLAAAVYLAGQNVYTLVAGMGTHLGRPGQHLSRPHSLLEKILSRDDLYVNVDEQLPDADQLKPLPQPGLVGMPLLLRGGAKGILLAGYDPQKKTITSEELLLLHTLSQIAADNLGWYRERQQVQEKMAELEVLNAQLTHQLALDGPTGLYNKRTFHEDLDNSLSEVRSGKSYYLLLMDLDKFKNVNARFGHAVGDAVITKVGTYFCELSAQRAYRAGGDKFALIIEARGDLQVVKTAQKIKRDMGRIFIAEDADPLTVSLGIALADQTIRSGEEWYCQAKKALEEAKTIRNAGIYLASTGEGTALLRI